jgi:hypothetical protein
MNLQAQDSEAIAERRCVTLANLWERQPEDPTWIWVQSPQLATYEPWSKASIDESYLVGQTKRSSHKKGCKTSTAQANISDN